jgi:hypothetical protein
MPFYSLLAACADCQADPWETWETWTTSCLSTFDTFESLVPTTTVIPGWANLDFLVRRPNSAIVMARALMKEQAENQTGYNPDLARQYVINQDDAQSSLSAASSPMSSTFAAAAASVSMAAAASASSASVAVAVTSAASVAFTSSASSAALSAVSAAEVSASSASSPEPLSSVSAALNVALSATATVGQPASSATDQPNAESLSAKSHFHTIVIVGGAACGAAAILGAFALAVRRLRRRSRRHFIDLDGPSASECGSLMMPSDTLSLYDPDHGDPRTPTSTVAAPLSWSTPESTPLMWRPAPATRPVIERSTKKWEDTRSGAGVVRAPTMSRSDAGGSAILPPDYE